MADWMDELIARLEAAPWRATTGLTPEAKALIDEHLSTLRAILPEIMKRRGDGLVDAYSFAVFAGNKAKGDALMDKLFGATFRNAGVREPIMWAVLAAYNWKSNELVGDLPNPWGPVVKLLELGYPISSDDIVDEDGTEHVDLCVGHKGGIETFHIL